MNTYNIVSIDEQIIINKVQQKGEKRMDEQTATTLLVYIETNRSFIEERLYDTFKIPCLKEHELKDLDLEEMTKTINHIFRFGANNPDMKVFFQSVPGNIQSFIDEKYRNTSEMDDLFIDVETLVEVVLATINGAKKKPEIPEKIQVEEIKQQNPEITPKKKEKPKTPQQKPPEKPKKFIVPKPKTPEKKNFIQKHQMPQTKMPARYLMNLPKKPKKPVEEQIPDLPEPLDLSYIEKNKKNIQTRLEYLYKHYCSQQQNLGAHATFDRIKSECEHMTVGKFLLFCKTTGVFKGKQITKEFMMSKFKKVGDGKKEISFEQFKQLLKQIDEEYVKLKGQNIKEKDKDEEGQNKKSIIPTFEARLLLHAIDFKKNKKSVDLPFSTRQKEGRELKDYYTLNVSIVTASQRYSSLEPNQNKKSMKTSNIQNNKKSELTSHSGKFSNDLLFDIEAKNSQKVNKKHHRGNSDSHEEDKKSKIIRLDNIGKQKLPGMDWIIEQDASDQTFMKDYRLRDVVGDIKKRVHDVEKLEKKQQKNF